MLYFFFNNKRENSDIVFLLKIVSPITNYPVFFYLSFSYSALTACGKMDLRCTKRRPKTIVIQLGHCVCAFVSSTKQYGR